MWNVLRGLLVILLLGVAGFALKSIVYREMLFFVPVGFMAFICLIKVITFDPDGYNYNGGSKGCSY